MMEAVPGRWFWPMLGHKFIMQCFLPLVTCLKYLYLYRTAITANQVQDMNNEVKLGKKSIFINILKKCHLYFSYSHDLSPLHFSQHLQQIHCLQSCTVCNYHGFISWLLNVQALECFK